MTANALLLVVWDLQHRAPLLRLPCYDRPIDAAALSSDGSRIVIGSRGIPNDGQRYFVSVLEVAGATERWRLEQHVPSGAVAFSADGSRVWSAGGTATHPTLDERSAATGALLAAMPLPGRLRHLSSFGDDRPGLTVANGPAEFCWRLGDPPSRRVRVRQCASPALLSPDGRRLAAVDVWARLTIRDLPAGRVLQTVEAVADLAWSADGTLYLMSTAGTLQRWSATGGVEVLATSETAGWDGVAGLGLAPDRLLIAETSGAVRLLDRAGQVRAVLPADRRPVLVRAAISRDGGSVCLLTMCDGPRVWRMAQAALAPLPRLRQLCPAAVAFAPAGERLLLALPVPASQRAPQVLVWDLERDRAIAEWDPAGAAVRELAWSPGGGWAAACLADGRLQVWDARTGRRLPLGQFAGRDCRRIAAVDEHTLVWIDSRGWLRLADPRTGRPRAAVRLAESTSLLEAGSGGGLLVTGGGETQVWRADGAGCRAVGTLSGNRRWGCVAVAGDGSVAAAAEGSCDILLLDPRTGAPRSRLTGADAPMIALRWLPDEQHLVGVDRNSTVQVWDTASRLPALSLLVLTGERQPSWLALWPDGRYHGRGVGEPLLRRTGPGPLRRPEPSWFSPVPRL